MVETQIYMDGVADAMKVDSLFSFLLGLIITGLIVYILVRVFEALFAQSDMENKFENRITSLEKALVDKIALKKGIDLDKEELKMNLTGRQKFRRKLYKQMAIELFEKEE